MEILDKQEVATILKRPRSKLVSMWKRDSPMSWASSLNAPPKLYTPSEGTVAHAAKVALPGEECGPCKIRRGKCHSVWVYSYYRSFCVIYFNLDPVAITSILSLCGSIVDLAPYTWSLDGEAAAAPPDRENQIQ